MAYTPEAPGTYQGNQVILNSDRLLFNAKEDSILLFSKEAIGFSTKGSFHFDTSPDGDQSKFVINSPKIYLGLDENNEYPTQPAVLGDELEEVLVLMVDLTKNLINDICNKVAYVVTPPGGITGINPANKSMLQTRLDEIEDIKDAILEIKSLNTKLV